MSEEDKHAEHTEEETTVRDAASMYAILVFAIVFIIVGLPLWWKTTEVYRVSLPYNEINSLPSLKVIHTVPVTLIVADKSIAQERLRNSLTEKLLGNEENQLEIKYHLTVRDISKEELHILYESLSVNEFSEMLHTSEIEIPTGHFHIYILPENSPLGHFDTIISIHRSCILMNRFSEEELVTTISAMLKYIVVKETMLQSIYVSTDLKARNQPDKERMRPLGATLAFDITFNLIVPQPSVDDVHWDISQAVEMYVKPFLQKLSILGSVNISSQVLYMATLNIQTKLDSKSGEHVLEMDHLSSIINPLETKLGSDASLNPSLNFVVYVPSQAQSPLKIYNEKGQPLETNAFLSPRWGGILIYNPHQNRNSNILPRRIDINMKEVMEIFLSQLRLLIGLPDNLQDHDKVIIQQSSVCANWEVDFLLRRRAQEQLSVAISSLYSLGQLLGTISNIVIRDDVGDKVYTSVNLIKNSIISLHEGDLQNGYLQAKQAFMLSEEAFFDQSLLALLYFPDDQKYAIYIPLFLPVGIPVLLSLRHVLTFFKKKDHDQKRKKTD